MTVGFVAVFSGFGILFSTAQAGLQGDILPYVSYVTVVLGVVLVVLGVKMARGGGVGLAGLKVAGVAPTAGFRSQLLYGATFALASMSCTIGPLLVVVTGALDAPNPLGALLPFVIYGVGMGTSVLTVSLVAALAGSTVVAGLRKRTPAIMRGAGVLMIIAGAYVFLFGLAEVLPRWGIRTLDGMLRTTSEWQAAVTRTIDSWGPPVLIALVVAAAIAAALLILRRKSSASANPAN
jgi:cytochrome c biogenesis protein CcdA